MNDSWMFWAYGVVHAAQWTKHGWQLGRYIDCMVVLRCFVGLNCVEGFKKRNEKL